MENEKMAFSPSVEGGVAIGALKNPDGFILFSGNVSDEVENDIMRRAVAAWNYCAGVPTAELESKGADAGFWGRACARLKGERDKLQEENAALRAAVNEMERMLPGFQEIERLHPGALEQYGIATLNDYRQALTNALAKMNEK